MEAFEIIKAPKMETSLVKGSIAFDKQKYLDYAQDIADAYDGLTISEDNLQTLSATISTINKLIKALNDGRIAIDKKFDEPKKVFDDDVKEIIGVLEKPLLDLKSQSKTYEDNRIEKKHLKIIALYETLEDEIKSAMSLESCLDEKWKNKGCLFDDIKKGIEEFAEATLKDLNVIKSQKSDIEEKAIALYSRQRNLAEALQLITDDRIRKEEILAAQKLAEEKAREEVIRQSERQAQVIETEHKQELEKVSTEVIESLTPIAEEVEEIYNYNITLGADAKRKLELFMNSVGIEFELQESFL